MSQDSQIHGDDASAGEVLSAAVVDDLLARGVERVHRGAHREAALLLRRQWSRLPEDPRLENLAGLIAFGRGRYDQALEIFEGLLAANPEAHAPRLNAGLAALAAGALDRAIAHLRRAVAATPGHRRAMLHLALARYLEGNAEAARAALRAAGQSHLAALVTPDVSPALIEEIRAVATRSPPGGRGVPPVDREGFAEVGTTARAGGPPRAAVSGEIVVSPAADPDEAAPDQPRVIVSLDAPGAPPDEAFARLPDRSLAAEAAAVALPGPLLPPLVAGPPLELQGETAVARSGRLVSAGDRSGFILRPALAILGRGLGPVRPARPRPVPHRGPLPWPEEELLAFSGDCARVIAAPYGKVLALLRLEGQRPHHLRFRDVAAFEGCLAWRPESRPGVPVTLRLTGHGAALLAPRGQLTRAAIRPGRRLVVPSSRLVGWIGDDASVTPHEGGGGIVVAANRTGAAVLIATPPPGVS